MARAMLERIDTMILIDYVIDIVGENIRFDPEIKPELIKVKDGDRFVARVTQDGIWLIKVVDGGTE